MAWPLSQDYNEAIQQPGSCFHDPDLRAGQPVTNALGLPQTCSGGFADVYQMRNGERRWAVKCFTREIPGLQERYAHISAHLSRNHLPFLVRFEFLPRGIQVRGRWFPIVKMDWVEGLALNTFVRGRLDKPAHLDVLAAAWAKLSQRLRQADLGHCDLQHGNVLLVPGGKPKSLAIKLVDYDGVWAPPTAALKPREVGHPAYQHPQRRRECVYSPHVDRFSHLVIFTALQALIVGGAPLWERYDNGDNLLFRPQDFETPAESALFNELCNSVDLEVRRHAQALREACRRPLHCAPSLEEIAGGGAGAPQPTKELPEWVRTNSAEKPSSPKSTWSERVRKIKQKERFVTFFCAVTMLVIVGVVLFLAAQHKPPAKAGLPDVKDKPAADAPQISEPDLPPKPLGPEEDPSGEDTPPIVERDEAIGELPGIHFLREFRHGGWVNEIAFSPDGKLIVSAASDSNVRLWEVATGKELHTFGEHEGIVGCVAFSPDGRYILSGGLDRVLRLWDWDVEQKSVRAFEKKHGGCIQSVAFSPDGRYVLSASGMDEENGWVEGDDHSVRLWDVETGSQVAVFDHEKPVMCVRFSPDGRSFATSESSFTQGGAIRVWDTQGKWDASQWKVTYTLPANAPYTVFSPDGSLLLSASGTIRQWGAASGQEELPAFPLRDVASQCVAFSPDGRFVVSGGWDGVVRLWDFKERRSLREFISSDIGAVWSVAFSPDGRIFAAGNGDGTVRLWGLTFPAKNDKKRQGPHSTVKTTTLAATSEMESHIWRYTTEQPPDDWFAPAFDDSAWQEGEAGFGGGDPPGVEPHTLWATDDIWIRRTFELTNVNLGDPHLRIHHDDDAEVYLNGRQVAALSGYVTGYKIVPLDEEAASALRPGKNTIAIHCRQSGGPQYIDAGLMNVVVIQPEEK